jgi:protocatechuate 3,4-dioxygenase beta subunit
MENFRLAGLMLSLAAAAMAQDPPAAARKASVSGVVRFAGTLTPVPLANVFTEGADPVVTDSRGRYTIADLPPGQYQLQVEKSGTRTLSRKIVLAGFDLTAVDINFRFNGTVAGRVLDDNREPVAGAIVSVVTRLYSLGQLQSRRTAWATTNARGAYRIPNIATGEPVLLLATRFAEKVAGISDVPEDLKERQEVLADTYYPNSPVPGSAQPLTLRPGQTLDLLDIRMVKSRGYCADGVMATAGTAPAKLDFTLSRTEAVFSHTDGFGSTGNPAADGKFRICNLTPGEYRLTTQGPVPAARADFTFGLTPFTVMDQDVRRLQVVTPPLVTLSGEVTWDGADAPIPGAAPITVRAVPVDRRAIAIGGWSEMQGVSTTVPGVFHFPGMLMGDYEVAVLGLPTGQYVKDVTYGGASVLHQPLRLGNAPLNSRLGILIGRDGAVISAQVNDSDGKPVIDAYFYALPAAADSESALAETLAWGQTDRFGQFTTDTLPPGKYYVLAHRSGVGLSAFGIGRLWAARLSQGTEMELGHGGFRQVRLAPVDLR